MIKRIRESLMLKWMVFSIVLATIPLAIAGFNIIQIYQENLRKSVIAIEKEKAAMVVERTEAFFEKVTSALFLISKDKNFRKRDLSYIKGYLVDYLYSYDFLSELTLLDEKGQEIIKVSEYKRARPTDLRNKSKSEMFGVASKGRIYYGEFDPTAKLFPSMLIAVPIERYKEGSNGVLSAEIHLTYFWDLIPQTQIGKRGSTYVVDKEGNLLAHSDRTQILLGLNVKHLPMVNQVIEGKEGELEFEHPRGEKYLAVYKPIKKLGWGVIVQVPVEEAYAPLRHVANIALKWILIALSIAIIFSFFLTRKLTHPIKQLSHQMGKVSQGNLDVQIAATTKDELGFLTESFNQMIQDLKQSQEALKKAEEKYRRIFEDSKDAVYITSIDGRIIDFNQAGVDLFGYESKEEMIQISVKDTYLNPEERKKFQDEISKEGFVKDFEVKLKRKDGDPIDVLITSIARKDREGNIIGYEGIIKDISYRKRMEEELLQRSEELQTLYDLSVLINQTLDLDRVLPIALERILNLIDFEAGSIHLLKEDEDTLELKSHIGQSALLAENIKFLKIGEGVAGKAVQLKKPITFTIDEYPTPRILPLLRERGVQFLVGIPLLTKNKAIGSLTLSSRSMHQLTQREINLLENIGNQIGLAFENAKLFSNVVKAKSEWETTFDAVTDLIIVRDKDYRIIRVNKAAFERFGLKPEEMIGKRCFETFHHGDEPCEGCYVSETLRTKRPVSGEMEGKYLNGVFQYHTFPIYDETGEVIVVVELTREITEKKRIEMEKEVINNINKILASSLDVRGVVKAVHSELKRVFDSERMTITHLEEEGNSFRFFSLERDYDDKELFDNPIYPLKGTSMEEAVNTGLPVVVSDTAKSDLWFHQKLLREGVRSTLVFPLEYNGVIIGTMNFGSKETNGFAENQFNFLHQITPGLAISIQNSLLFEETKKRLDELVILYEVTKISTSSFNLDHMLTEIVNSLINVFKFETFCILLVDEMTKRLIPHPSYKGLSLEHVKKIELYLGKGITGWVAEKGESLLASDVRKDPRYISSDESILSEICAPLKVGQKIIGVIDAQSRELNAFSENDLRMLNIASGQIATAIENIRLHEEIMKSEEKYRTVVEGALDGVCVIAEDKRLKYVNKRLAEIQGYIQEEMIGIDFRDFLDEEGKRLVTDRYSQSQKGEKLSPRFELNLLRKNGEKINTEVSARIIKDSQGNVNTIAFLKDITEKKRMEEQLLQSEKLRALGEMASGVAHDFNNALAAILGNTQLLLYTAKDEGLKESLKIIEKVARDSAQTVKRLQDFTRRRVHQELFKINVNAIIQDAIEITKPKWKDEVQGRGIHIEIVSNFEEIPPVVGNASELREVITNMIFNAIEAMPEGGKIEIRTFQRKSNVYIQISDTGIGMTEEVRKKVFEPFFTTKTFSNTGLGLSMSYGIIKRFGGEIEVESKIGHGTTFTIILPIELEGKEEVAISPIIKKGRKARILVIDDEEAVRRVLSQIFSQVKHQVTVAENGEEGIRLFKEKEFDIVLTDLGMPGMSGWEVGMAIKKMSPHTPVGMITGWGVELDQAETEENGIDFVIPKPFQFDQILKVIDETIASKGKPFMT